MSDIWTGPRSPQWIITLLNSDDEPLGELLGVTDGSVEILTLARLGGSASLSLTQTSQEIDWMTNRVLIQYDSGIPGASLVPWGVWLFTSPKTSLDITQRNEVALLSKMVVIDGDTVTDSYSIEAGTNIVDAVDFLIRSTGETRIALTASDATLTNTLVFEPGESKLTIINKLLESAGYQALWVDGSGQYRVGPYVAPGDRAVARVFEAGEFSIHKPGWTREQDLAGVPNRVVVFSEGTDDEPAIIGLDENWDLDSPFSIPNRNGLVITRREEVSDISTQEEADALATRYLIGGMSPVAGLEVTHAIVPLEPGDRVTLIDGHPAESRDATVQRMSMQLQPFSQCEATWREV